MDTAQQSLKEEGTVGPVLLIWQLIPERQWDIAHGEDATDSAGGIHGAPTDRGFIGFYAAWIYAETKHVLTCGCRTFQE